MHEGSATVRITEIPTKNFMTAVVMLRSYVAVTTTATVARLHSFKTFTSPVSIVHAYNADCHNHAPPFCSETYLPWLCLANIRVRLGREQASRRVTGIASVSSTEQYPYGSQY